MSEPAAPSPDTTLPDPAPTQTTHAESTPGTSAETSRASAPPRASRPSLAPAPTPPKKPLARLREALLAPLRDPNPILLKELRATFRTALYARFLYLVTGLLALIVLVAGAMSGQGEVAPADTGRILFHTYFTLVMIVICLVAPSYAATSITTERETRTYESLLLSGLGGGRIVWGKFVAYYGSISLVVTALAPVIGVVFLFGGISPLAVVVSFGWVLLVLSTAIALGIAVSSRLETTRMAIVASSGLFMPGALIATSLVGVMGADLSGAWSDSFDGPFWFAQLLANHVDEIGVWGLVVFVPLAFFGSATWYFLASAVAGVRHPGEDRSTPLKVWTAVTTPLLLAAVATLLTINIPTYARSLATNVDITTCLAALYGLVVGLTFANEPPLPPRPKKRPPSRFDGLRKLVAGWIGPGAAGTARFAYAAAAAPPLGVAACGLLLRTAFVHGTAGELSRADLAMLWTGLASATVVVAFTALAIGIRLWSRSGAVARGLTIVVLAGSFVAPALLSLAVQSPTDGSLPPTLALSPIAAPWTGAMILDEGITPRLIAPMLGIGAYGAFAAMAAIGIEVFVRQVRRREEAARAERRAQVSPSP